jgi:hypothetical protein
MISTLLMPYNPSRFENFEFSIPPPPQRRYYYPFETQFAMASISPVCKPAANERFLRLTRFLG